MAAGENPKLKLLYLYDILRKKTDEDHAITMEEILASLEMRGIHAERKSIYTDIQTLKDFGANILGEKVGRGYEYKYVGREFQMPELKLLVDAVQSSRFITTRKSRELIRKIEGLASIYEAGELDRQVHVAGRIKTMNESIYYNVDAIHRAIAEDVQIRFKYFRWTHKKEQELRHDGADYVVSPWGLVWDDENYYLIGYDATAGEKHGQDAASEPGGDGFRTDGSTGSKGEIRHYRVDKMKNIRLTKDKREGKSEFDERNMATYTEKRFGMYDGDIVRITLLCKNDMAGVIIDRFGKDTPMIPADDDHFEAKVDMALSFLFLGWVASMGDAIKVIAPDEAVEQMREMVKGLNEIYG